MPKSTGKKRSPWDPNARPYGVNKGPRGNPQQWKAAYDQRMSANEADEVLGASPGETPFSILGVVIGCAWAAIRSAYRKLVFKVHPDHGGTDAAFKKVNAAYSKLADQYGES